MRTLAILLVSAAAVNARAETKIVLTDQHSHLFGELAIAIGQKRHVPGLLALLPFVHDERFVDRNADDLVHAVAVLEQVGVNAPGSEKTTTVRPAKISSVVRLIQSDPLRVRNDTWGTF